MLMKQKNSIIETTTIHTSQMIHTSVTTGVDSRG